MLLPLYRLQSQRDTSALPPSFHPAAFSNEDLETAFFSIDIESTGSIPKSSFADALADVGVVIDESAADLLFDKYDRIV